MFRAVAGIFVSAFIVIVFAAFLIYAIPAAFIEYLNWRRRKDAR